LFNHSTSTTYQCLNCPRENRSAPRPDEYLHRNLPSLADAISIDLDLNILYTTLLNLYKPFCLYQTFHRPDLFRISNQHEPLEHLAFVPTFVRIHSLSAVALIGRQFIHRHLHLRAFSRHL
jgi:hypothetical protein